MGSIFYGGSKDRDVLRALVSQDYILPVPCNRIEMTNSPPIILNRVSSVITRLHTARNRRQVNTWNAVQLDFTEMMRILQLPYIYEGS
jgi:hypothetical protein